MTDVISLDQYQTRLPSFEGPLDLLLRLIERQRLDITEVSLVAVTDQFLVYVAEMDIAEPDVIADFTTVGTRLTVLKSRSLLPRPPVVEATDEPDPADLVEQLKAYKRVKDVARQLGERRETGAAAFGPRSAGPVARTTDAGPTKVMQYEAAVLAMALRRRLSTVKATVQTIRARRIVSIREMTERLLDMVSQRARVPFRSVVETDATRTDVATAFLAMLVLVRRRIIDASQDGLFADIELAKIAGQPVDDPDAVAVDDEFLN